MAMWRRRRRTRPTRAQLIETKHALEGEISALAAEVRRLRQRSANTSQAEARLEALRSRHYQTRLEIDRTDPKA